MTASKGNKVYTIDETAKLQYQNDGYDIYDDSGALVAYAKGKTVLYKDYAKVVSELEELKKPKGKKTLEKEGE